jgi:predicted nucleic acid-binding protein
MPARLKDLERAIEPGERLLLDTSALAAFLDAEESAHPAAVHVLNSLVASGRNEALVAMVSVMDLLAPLEPGSTAQETVLLFLTHHPHLGVVSLDIQVAQEAHLLRAECRFGWADGLLIGTALACQVPRLVTNDPSWNGKLAPLQGRIHVLNLSSYVLGPA